MAQNSEMIDIEFRELTEEELADCAEIYKGSGNLPCMRVGPKGYYMHKEYKKMASDVYNMPLRPDDTFVVTYQRSGTTLTQELVWLLANDLDFETASNVILQDRFPFMEICTFFDQESKERLLRMSTNKEKTQEIIKQLSTPGTKIVANTPSPRFIKTHLPFAFLPPKILDTAKVVYVARDPRDVIVSSYHLSKLFNTMNFRGTFEQLWEGFRKNLYLLTPYFEHVKEAWAMRHHPNMLFLFYEELSKDLPGTIRRISEFLGKEELNQEQMERLCDHLSFENFKKNKSVNFDFLQGIGFTDENEDFIRKGKSGGWRDYFTGDLKSEVEQWVKENLQDTDLSFPSMENN